MSSAITPRHYASNSPHIVAEPSCLRRRFIGRYLSRLLVLILLILTPLTYSNDNTPNFQPDGVSSFSLKTKTSSSIAVMRPDAALTVTLAEAIVVSLQSNGFSPHFPPVCSSQLSRAPPA